MLQAKQTGQRDIHNQGGSTTYRNRVYTKPIIQRLRASPLLPARSATGGGLTNIPVPIILLIMREATSHTVSLGFCGRGGPPSWLPAVKDSVDFAPAAGLSAFADMNWLAFACPFLLMNVEGPLIASPSVSSWLSPSGLRSAVGSTLVFGLPTDSVTG